MEFEDYSFFSPPYKKKTMATLEAQLASVRTEMAALERALAEKQQEAAALITALAAAPAAPTPTTADPTAGDGGISDSGSGGGGSGGGSGSGIVGGGGCDGGGGVQTAPFSPTAPPSTSALPTSSTPSATPLPLSKDEVERYGRQLILPELGVDGQRRLAAASVLVVGAGGLGCPTIMYLAAAGVGHIGVVDGDVIERSNLHRQVS